jgi:hypothetical protein
MSSLTLVHPEETLTVPILPAITKCRLFEKNPNLTTAPYHIQSPVPLSIFREFITAFEGKAVKINDTNLKGLKQ